MVKLLIIISLLAGQSAEWRDVAGALSAKHEDEATVVVECADPTNSLEVLRRERPRYVAFVMQPDELNRDVAIKLHEIVRDVDDDPFDDAIWGVVTGPTAADALRIASSREPAELRSMLATTGVDKDVVPGPVTVLSDAFPKGEWWQKDESGNVSLHSTIGEMVSAFIDAWNTIDPDILLTSSHATEHNLEMPFSRGMIVTSPEGGDLRFVGSTIVRMPGERERVACESSDVPAAKPAVREKVWLAAGNCLIANHLDDHDMVMTALSFGKVNQFVGYIEKTWFGFVGWNTWGFFKDGAPLNESYYAANQWLAAKLAMDDFRGDIELKGLLWDRNATLFYGDPMQKVSLPSRPEEDEKSASHRRRKHIVIHPSSASRTEYSDAPHGCKVSVAEDGRKTIAADDFTLVLP